MLQKSPNEIMRDVKEQIVADNKVPPYDNSESKWRWFWGKPPKVNKVSTNPGLEGFDSDNDEEKLRLRAQSLENPFCEPPEQVETNEPGKDDQTTS